MKYLVKRGEAQFGPYSLAELQRYVQSGQLSPDDLAQSEGMTEWMPVSQIVGTIPLAQAVAGSAHDEQAQNAIVGLPPNLPWWILLVLSVITRQLFNMIWAFVLANWARRLSGKNTPMVLVAMYPASMISGFIAIGLDVGRGSVSTLGTLLIMAGVIVYIFGVFSIRSAMEDYYNTTENIGLKLSGPMTFFFGIVYLQYHVNDLARSRKNAFSLA